MNGNIVIVMMEFPNAQGEDEVYLTWSLLLTLKRLAVSKTWKVSPSLNENIKTPGHFFDMRPVTLAIEVFAVRQ
jgi:hypothetical protein